MCVYIIYIFIYTFAWHLYTYIHKPMIIRIYHMYIMRNKQIDLHISLKKEKSKETKHLPRIRVDNITNLQVHSPIRRNEKVTSCLINKARCTCHRLICIQMYVYECAYVQMYAYKCVLRLHVCVQVYVCVYVYVQIDV